MADKTNCGGLSMQAFKYLEFLFEDTGPFKLKLLDKVLGLAIPFNRPHGFKLLEMGKDEIIVEIPYRRINFNHLKGIHACAMATAGEYAAGLLLLKNFPPQKYRIIMSHLDVKYTYQGKMALFVKSTIGPEMRMQAENEIDEKQITVITMTSQITDKKGNDVATVQSTWQLKPWTKVKTKL